ncbi:PREDICTED: zinc finger AN1 and C2H2 domain-containing stress-associated protein 11-like [Camelina sativa]|nr:PREDICTED: zinc finger AN1 and C2H2 domain-containing stress-associated protein 11-like [Camelina sativa]
MGFLSSSSSRKEAKTTRPNKASASTSSSSSTSRWSNLLSSAEAGISRLGNDISQKLQFSSSSSNDGIIEVCPQCGAKFSSVTSLVEHVEKTHERNKKQIHGKVTVDVCPKCSRGFRDPVDLVNHIERDHRGTSKA